MLQDLTLGLPKYPTKLFLSPLPKPRTGEGRWGAFPFFSLCGVARGTSAFVSKSRMPLEL